MAAHSLAETYAVLTRLPLRPRISAEEAWQLIERDLLGSVSLVSLTPEQYTSLVRRLAEYGLIGGVVYDALILEAAAAAGVDRVLTFNTADFSRLAKTLGGSVTSPYDVTA